GQRASPRLRASRRAVGGDFPLSRRVGSVRQSLQQRSDRPQKGMCGGRCYVEKQIASWWGTGDGSDRGFDIAEEAERSRITKQQCVERMGADNDIISGFTTMH